MEVCSRFWSAVRRGRGGAARNAFTHASSGSVSDMAGGGEGEWRGVMQVVERMCTRRGIRGLFMA